MITISTKGKNIDVASTILAGYERSNMTGFNADNGVMETVKIKQATKKGYVECEVGGVADLSYVSSTTRRGRVQDNGQVSPTLTVADIDGIKRIESQYRIRKLTPKECWRLMGFTDEEFEKAAAVNSNTQLYKQAGNSIVVDVLVAIFSEMINSLENKTPKYQHMEQMSLFDYE
jgi:DNA (cytosine-5)-methyltransferase 1